jgi:two component regulator with propeller domain
VSTIMVRSPLLWLLIVLAAAFSSQWAMTEVAVPGGQRIVHHSWTLKDGAPEGVQALAQTADGYLWLGTQFGLFRFDGRHFETFQSAFGDQLMFTNVSALTSDPTGGLWVGAFSKTATRSATCGRLICRYQVRPLSGSHELQGICVVR